MVKNHVFTSGGNPLLLNRVLGELIQDGFVTNIADDLYAGGASPSGLLSNWSRVLGALKRSNLVLNIQPRHVPLLQLSLAGSGLMVLLGHTCTSHIHASAKQGRSFEHNTWPTLIHI